MSNLFHIVVREALKESARDDSHSLSEISKLVLPTVPNHRP